MFLLQIFPQGPLRNHPLSCGIEASVTLAPLPFTGKWFEFIMDAKHEQEKFRQTAHQNLNQSVHYLHEGIFPTPENEWGSETVGVGKRRRVTTVVLCGAMANNKKRASHLGLHLLKGTSVNSSAIEEPIMLIVFENAQGTCGIYVHQNATWRKSH